MINNRVKAFTILELTITMLVTALVIGITYTSYLIVFKSYTSFNTKNNELAVLVNLDHVLKRDFEKAEIVLKDTDGIALTIGENYIKYEFKPDFVVRHTIKKDTFKVQTQYVNFAFENVAINDVKNTVEQNRIDELGFTIVLRNENFSYHYHKQYSSANLIQRNPYAVN